MHHNLSEQIEYFLYNLVFGSHENKSVVQKTQPVRNSRTVSWTLLWLVIVAHGRPDIRFKKAIFLSAIRHLIKH